jgi:nitrogen fixation protein FixH
MKLHWGTGVVVVFVLFVAGILSLVFMAMSRDVDLVTDHPYDKGLSYRDRIAALERTAALKERPIVTAGREGFIVRFPSTLPAGADGTISLYRPDDRSRDRAIPVAPDSPGTQIVHVDSLDRGLWRVAVAWRQESLDYYVEQPLMLY